MKLTIGVTDHRDLVGDQLPALRDQVRAFFVDLDKEYPGLDLQVISPLADGSDNLYRQGDQLCRQHQTGIAEKSVQGQDCQTEHAQRNSSPRRLKGWQRDW